MTNVINWKNIWSGFGARVRAGLAVRPKSLALRESLSLGERRFAAVIECDGQRFLVGGGSQSVQLIARLNNVAETSATENQQ
jgi:flagellar biogenesis protein FliO